MLTLCKRNPHVVGVCHVMASNGGAEEGTTVPMEEEEEKGGAGERSRMRM